MIGYYATQGRFNVLPFVFYAAKWEMFEWWTPGWQVARALLMFCLSALTFHLLRRLNASHHGALAGASVFLWAPAAGEGWYHLTMAEPLGTAIALLMSIRALRYQRVVNWQREAALLAVGTVALIWTKELLIPLLVLPAMLALTFDGEARFIRPIPSRRNLVLLGTLVSATIIAAIPIAFFFLRASESAYSALYGTGLQSAGTILAIWISTLIPFELFVAKPNAVWAAALVGFVFLVGFGWRGFLRSETGPSSARSLLTLALILPLAGLLVYVPNPWIARFYTLPYLIGAAIFIGMAVTYVEFTPKGHLLSGASLAAMLLQAATSSSEVAARREAIQRRDDAVISFVSDSTSADTVIFATNRPPPEEWLVSADSGAAPRGLGATLSRFAQVSARPWPPTRDLSCDRARSYFRPNTQRFVVVNFEGSCRFEARPVKEITIPFRRLDWSAWTIAAESTKARIFTAEKSDMR